MAPIPHPDQLPDFPYQRVEMPRYARASYMGSRTLAHHSSYGCPFFCNFCAVVNMVNGRWLAQSAERTAKVTRHLVSEWGADAVEFDIHLSRDGHGPTLSLCHEKRCWTKP